MKKTFTLLFFAFISMSLLNGQEWYFETMFNSEGWVGIGQDAAGTQINVENELLTATTTYWEGPRINNPTLDNIRAADYSILSIRMANDAGAYHFDANENQVVKRIRVFWIRDTDEAYSADRMILHEYLPLEDPEEFLEHEIDLSQHPGWTGNVWALRLDLCYMGGKQVDVDYIILGGEASTDPEPVTNPNWQFKTVNENEQWNPVGETTITVENDMLTAKVDHWEGPKIAHQNLKFSAVDFSNLEIRMKNDADAHDKEKKIRVFWTREGDEAFSADRLIAFDYVANSEELKTHTVNLAAHAAWTGVITGLRLDLCFMGGKQVDIDYILLKAEETPDPDPVTVPDWQFKTASNSEQWNPVGETTITVENDILTAKVDHWEGPKIAHQNLKFSAVDFSNLVISMKNDGDAHENEKKIRVFWTREGDEAFSADRLIAFDYVANSAELKTHTINMAAHAAWTGVITGLRLDLCYMGGKQVDIDYIILKAEETPDPDPVTEPDWQFATDGDSEQWNSVGETAISVGEGILVASVDHWEGPKIAHQNLQFAATGFPNLMISLKNDADAHDKEKKIRVFWTREGDEAFSADRLVAFDYVGNSTELKTHTINLASHAAWSGVITALRLDLCFMGGKQVDVDFIKLVAAAEQRTLTISISGNGKVEVGDVEYTGVVTVDDGTELVLKAVPDDGYKFDGWSGDLISSNAEASLVMDADKTIVANFSAEGDEDLEALYEWFFETMFNPEGWVGIGEGDSGTQISVENELLTATANYWEGPRIHHPTLDNIPASNVSKLIINMSNDADAYHFNQDGDQVVKRIRVFWVRDTEEEYSADRMILYEYLPLEDPEEFQEHEIDLAQHAGWSGLVWALRLDLCYMGGKQVDIDYIMLMGTLPTTVETLPVIESFMVYPNPAKDHIYITGNWNEPVAYEIYSITGMRVSSGFIHSDKQLIGLAEISPGLYLLRVEDQVSKIIVR